MDKLELVNYDHDKLNINKLYSTEYDDLFKPQIKSRGIAYYNDGKITDFEKKGNVITAIISGGKDYDVSIEFLKNNKIGVKCNCLYHKDTDIYCKHVYSLLIKNKVDDEKKNFINAYESNKDKLLETMNLIEQLLDENKKYFYDYQLSFGLKLRKHYEKYIKEMNDKYDINSLYKLVSVVNDSFFHLNNSINDYNELIDMIEENKKEYERREKLQQEENKKQELANKSTDNQDSELQNQEDPLFEYLDNYIASMPREVLNKVREDSIANGEDTEIIDRALKIQNKNQKAIDRISKKLDKIAQGIEQQTNEIEEINKIYNQRKQMQEEKQSKSSISLSDIVAGVALGSLLTSKNKGKAESNGYDPWNFEEEELEEDDFYYEDID